ncbi:MAG: thiamine phosphate synthase [Nitrospina sp.]|nr:thiamine phosphate synthase [Nitrospina sp.]MBT5631597.1 thiamine phosphate synthase [Nitrospina sp.]
MTSAPFKAEQGLDFLRVYLISDLKRVGKDRFLHTIEEALQGGVRALQIREKDLSPKELLALALEVKALTQRYNAKLFINDRADIAVMAGVDGVHLTEASVQAGEIKNKFPDLIVGVSTHSIEGARLAETQGADFITFSPIYETPSKASYGPPQGLAPLRQVSQAVRLPVLALGGITLHRVSECLEQGAFGVALISDIWDSTDIKQHSSEYTQNLGGNTL